jgi:UDP-perosamine 4-acetyltransferase
MTVPCVILGGGGHALVIIDLLRESGEASVHGVLDRDPERWGRDILGAPVLGGDELLPRLYQDGVRQFIVGIGSVRDTGPRRRLFDLAVSHGLKPLRAVHPRAAVSRSADVGEGTVVLAGAVDDAGARIGVNVIVNTGAIVEHDCVLGDHVHVATGARLAGTVLVGQGAHIGIGATIVQGRRIGEGAVVGAGAVVLEDVVPGAVVAGVPARLLRKRNGRDHSGGHNQRSGHGA